MYIIYVYDLAAGFQGSGSWTLSTTSSALKMETIPTGSWTTWQPCSCSAQGPSSRPTYPISRYFSFLIFLSLSVLSLSTLLLFSSGFLSVSVFISFCLSLFWCISLSLFQPHFCSASAHGLPILLQKILLMPRNFDTYWSGQCSLQKYYDPRKSFNHHCVLGLDGKFTPGLWCRQTGTSRWWPTWWSPWL